jgi:hypothetical protein
MLNRTADPAGDVQRRPDGRARLSDLMLFADKTTVDRRPRCSPSLDLHHV